MDNKGQALIIVLKVLAVLHLLKEGHTLLTDMEPFLLPIVFVYLWLNVVLWRPRPEGFYLIVTFVAFQFLNYLYWFVTSTFLLPIITYSQESKLLWGALTLFYAFLMGWIFRQRAKVGYIKGTRSIRSIGVVLLSLSILIFSGSLTADTVGISGHEIIRFPQMGILNGAMSPDGRYLTIDRMGEKYRQSTMLWDTQQRKEVRSLLRGVYLHIQFSPNSKYVMINGGMEGVGIQVWDIETGLKIKEVDSDHRKGIRIPSASFSTDNESIAYGTKEGIKVIALHTDGITDIAIPHSGNKDMTFGVGYSPDGRYLVAAHGKDVVLLDAKTNKPIATLHSKLRTVLGRIAYSADGHFLALEGRQASSASPTIEDAIELWDMQKQTSLGAFSYDTQINALSFSPDNQYLAIGGNKKIVELIDTSSLKKTRLSGTHPFTAVYLLAFSPDGKSLYTGGGNDLKIWNLKETILADAHWAELDGDLA